jgi:hypothetical protein
MHPELAIVFVDEDDDKARHDTMREWVSTLQSGRPPTVIAVARQEFESWLLTDRDCIAKVIGRPPDDPGDPEAWPPTKAKGLLHQLALSAGSGGDRPLQVRREICSTCDLETMRNRSRSFARFPAELSDS